MRVGAVLAMLAALVAVPVRPPSALASDPRFARAVPVNGVFAYTGPAVDAYVSEWNVVAHGSTSKQVFCQAAGQEQTSSTVHADQPGLSVAVDDATAYCGSTGWNWGQAENEQVDFGQGATAFGVSARAEVSDHWSATTNVASAAIFAGVYVGVEDVTATISGTGAGYTASCSIGRVTVLSTVLDNVPCDGSASVNLDPVTTLRFGGVHEPEDGLVTLDAVSVIVAGTTIATIGEVYLSY